MIEWLIGFLVAYWWIYKRKKKESKPQDQEPIGNLGHNEIPFGYLKEDESIKDLT